MQLHPLLQRQLERIGIDGDAGPTAAASWQDLAGRVSRAYAEHDQERQLLERSQTLSSQEMAELNAALRTERDQLDRRVRERTEALQLSEARLGSLLSLSADWIWEQDQQLRFTYISDAIEAMTGIPASQWLGRCRFDGEAFEAPADALEAYQACVDRRQAFRDFTYSYTRTDGVRRYLRISGEPVFDDFGNFAGYRGVGRDVTQATVSELRVQELARLDSLTGLPNRNMFLGELDRAIARARRLGSSFAVSFIDLDRFKVINDTLGHDAGDELLRIMAARLVATLRASDMVGRLGGDEFVVLLEGDASLGALRAATDKLLRAISEPMTVQGCSFVVTGSIGVSVYPGDGADAALLLRHADAAMYLAKDKGKNNVQFYTAELADQAAEQYALEADLRLAIERNQLLLHFQPKVDVASGRLLSVEALLRWQHPSRGLVAPAEFIPLAEERGLIVPIGRWVLQAACRQMREWRNAGLEVLPVAVNLSARQLHDEGFARRVSETLERTGFPAENLELEITESMVMRDAEGSIKLLQALRDTGVRIAIDDFGTGYSSLAYLKRFPIDCVKIDRSFIRDLPDDRDDASITRSIIAMAHNMKLDVVAEGVETESQLAFLHAYACDEIQGYLFSKPLEAAAFERFLDEHADRSTLSDRMAYAASRPADATNVPPQRL